VALRPWLCPVLHLQRDDGDPHTLSWCGRCLVILQDSVFSDSDCYSQAGVASPPLDHTVLVVGYSIPAEGFAYWIIQNSWGTGWGDPGLRVPCYADRGGAPGICGMHVAPALYPVVRGGHSAAPDSPEATAARMHYCLPSRGS